MIYFAIFAEAIIFIKSLLGFVKSKIYFSSIIFFIFLFALSVSTLYVSELYSAEMQVKVFFFIASIFFAFRYPKAAIVVFLVLYLLNFYIQSLAGNAFSKLATVPFIVFACFTILSFKFKRNLSLIIIALAVMLEFAQAVVLGSRGGVVFILFSIFILLSGKRLALFFAKYLFFFLPLVVPLSLALVFLYLTSDPAVIDSTASNFERSAMAFWVVVNFPEYLLVGPGPVLFNHEINLLKVIGGHALAHANDPHHFILSAWIYLGSLHAIAFYLLWVLLFSKVFTDPLSVTFSGRFYILLGLAGLLIFTLSPPDTFSRLFSAILIGVFISGLRNENSLLLR